MRLLIPALLLLGSPQLIVGATFARPITHPVAFAQAPCNPNYVAFDPATNTWTVAPTGTDDTANVQCAFDEAVASRSESVVQLTEGWFHTNKIVVTGFNGTFKGAGQDLTSVDVLRGLDPEAGGVEVDFPEKGAAPAQLFLFLDPVVTISNLTIDITPKKPGVGRFFLNGFSNSVGGIGLRGETINATVEHLTIVGHEGPGESREAFNVTLGILVTGPDFWNEGEGEGGFIRDDQVQGSVTIADCTFQRVLQPIRTAGLTSGTAHITRNHIRFALLGIVNTDSHDAHHKIVDNDLQGVAAHGIFAWQGSHGVRSVSTISRWVIQQNTVEMDNGRNGIILRDTFHSVNGLKTLDAVIRENLVSGEYLHGINDVDTEGTVILDNQLSGGL